MIKKAFNHFLGLAASIGKDLISLSAFAEIELGN